MCSAHERRSYACLAAAVLREVVTQLEEAKMKNWGRTHRETGCTDTFRCIWWQSRKLAIFRSILKQSVKHMFWGYLIITQSNTQWQQHVTVHVICPWMAPHLHIATIATLFLSHSNATQEIICVDSWAGADDGLSEIAKSKDSCLASVFETSRHTSPLD